MTDLAQIIRDSVTTIVTEDRVKAEVEKRIEAMVADIIKDEMRSYSDTGRAITKAVQESLKVGNINLPSYGAVVTAMLRKQIEDTVAPIVAGKLAEDMAELLNLAPKTAKLSEIVKEMLESSSAYEDGETGDLVTCIVRPTEYGSTHIYLDEHQHYDERNYHQCDISVFISKEGTILSASERDKEFAGKSKSKSFGRTYGLMQKLQAYYACGTVIEIDEDSVSTYRDYD